MGIIKKYKVVIVVVLPILILVLVRSVGYNSFKVNSEKWAEPSFTMSNIIPVNQVGTVPGEKLIINLGEENMEFNDPGIDMLYIRADSILNKNNLNLIRQHDGPVMLITSETAVSARIWMVLSQLGCNNLYIIANDTNNEVLKYKFRPDTSVRPEL